MASNKWLNIVVDGNADLAPYWPKIVSDYLQKIVKRFCKRSREQGAKNATCQLGLVMYNANSDLGCDVQYIQWTKDVDYFLGFLSCLAFNGERLNQYAMAEGLAEALMMYPKGSDGTTTATQDYYNGERHCILVATGDPVPRKMLVTVPRVREGKLVGTPLDTFKADFLQVAHMFSPLAVSLSVITPEQHAIFGQIFNLGNNDITEMAYAPLANYKVGQFVVLLSRNFKEAREALHGKRVVLEDLSQKRSLESTRTPDVSIVTELFTDDLKEDHLFSTGNKTTIAEQAIENSYRKISAESMRTTDITLTELFTNDFQEDLFSAGKTMTIGEQAIENSYRKRSAESMKTTDFTLTELFTNGFEEDLFSGGNTTTNEEQAIENSYRKRSVEPMKSADFALTEFFSSGFQEDLFSASKATKIGEQTIEAAKAVRPKEIRSVASNIESQLVEVIPNATTDKKHVSGSSSSSLIAPVNVFEDMAELNADMDIVLPSIKPKSSFTLVEDPLTGLFMPAQPPSDDDQDFYRQEQTYSTKKTISMDALKAVEVDLENALEGGSSAHITSRNQEHTNSNMKTISMDALKAAEDELQNALGGGSSSAQNTSRNQTCFIDLTKDDKGPRFPTVTGSPYSRDHHNLWRESISNEKGVQISPGLSPKVPSTINTTIGSSSKRPLVEPRGKAGVLEFSLGNSSSVLPNQNSSSLWPAAPKPWYEGVGHGEVSRGVGPEFRDPITEPENQDRNGFGNSLFPQAMSKPIIPFQPYTTPLFPVYPDVGGSNHFGGGSRGNFSSGLLREQHITGSGPLHIPDALGRSTGWLPPVSRMPHYFRPGSLLPPPSVMDFHDHVHTWEGYLGGKLPSGSKYIIRAKAFRRASSPFTLTFQWSARLEIIYHLPLNAFMPAHRLMCDIIDYVFFHITQYNNHDLYDFLIKENKCGKIDLPTQTLILYPTESEFFFVGIVFPCDAIFMEPGKPKQETGARDCSRK